MKLIVDKISLIVLAISQHKIIKFNYHHEERIVEPHHYGYLNGKLQLHAYQIDGGSESGGIPEWRNFEIDQIEHLAQQNESFAIRESHHPDNSNYSEVIKSV